MDVEKLVDPALTAIASAAIEKIAGSLKKKPGVNIDASRVRARLVTYAGRIGRVKTLLSPEGFVQIEEFYCPPRLLFGDHRLVPNRSDDFKDQVLVEGIAGHGKSILLRYLCANSIIKNGRVSLFYELRRLDYMKPLARIVMDDLIELGLPGNSETLKSISLENGLEIYLDGFDEIDQKKAIKIDRDIDHFAKTYEFARIFVSSRPYVGLSKNSTFNTYKAQYLNEADIFRLIEKLCKDRALSDALIKKLKDHQGKVLGLLETPLLVTLLVAQYKQTQQMPEQLSDFYESVFSALFDRHDSFKVPYQRPRRLNVSTSVYKKAFQKFCFASLFVETLDTDIAEKISLWALGSSVTKDASDFLKDVSEISSLIDEDEGIWSFIHSSVKEYYAASFLMSGSDEDLEDRARRLYESDVAGLATEQVFRFCREIDEYRHAKFIELPYCRAKISPIPMDRDPSDDDLIAWVMERLLDIEIPEPARPEGWFFSLIFSDVNIKPMQFYVLSQIGKQVDAILRESKMDPAKIRQFRDLPILMGRVRSELSPSIAKLKASIRLAEEVVGRQATGRKDTGNFLDSLLSL